MKCYWNIIIYCIDYIKDKMHNYIFCWFAQEFQSCNTLPCPDLKKTTPWTPWTPVNISDNGGHYEQRFRYTCKARVPEPSLLEVGRQRIEMRYCSSDGSTGCSTDGEISFYHSSLRFFICHSAFSFSLLSSCFFSPCLWWSEPIVTLRQATWSICPSVERQHDVL